MSTERCEQNVYERGTGICYFGGPRSTTLEQWCVEIRADLPPDCAIDWHQTAGRAVFLQLGMTKEKARRFIETRLPRLVQLHHACTTNWTPAEDRHCTPVWL